MPAVCDLGYAKYVLPDRTYIYIYKYIYIYMYIVFKTETVLTI